MDGNAAGHDLPGSDAGRRLKTMWRQARRNPQWLLMELLSRFPLVRNTIKSLQRTPTINHFNLSASQFESLDTCEFIASLKRDGFCEGLKLPTIVLTQLQRAAATEVCYGNDDTRFGFKYSERFAAQMMSGRVFSQATYLFPDGLRSIMDQVTYDPLLLVIAARYLNALPVVTGCRLWWIFATKEQDFNSSLTTSFFHYDKDDYSALRLFFYVTPVTDDNHGPHVVIRGSHTKKKLSQLFSLSERRDSGISDHYQKSDLVSIYGGAGSGFAEDPFCFHKATRPIAADRLVLEIKYATRDFKVFSAPERSAARSVFGTSQTAAARSNASEVSLHDKDKLSVPSLPLPGRISDRFALGQRPR